MNAKIFILIRDGFGEGGGGVNWVVSYPLLAKQNKLEKDCESSDRKGKISVQVRHCNFYWGIASISGAIVFNRPISKYKHSA